MIRNHDRVSAGLDRAARIFASVLNAEGSRRIHQRRPTYQVFEGPLLAKNSPHTPALR